MLPLNHPLRMVEEFNLLDLLSDGRAVFSAGRGYDAGEYGPFAASFRDSREVFDEQMEYMMAAWRQSPFEFHGKYYSTPEPLTVLPRYLQNVIPVLPRDRRATPPHIAYFVDIVERLRTAKPEQFGDRSIVTGDAEHCVEVLKKCEHGGLSEVICYFNFGLLDHKDTLRAMERFARDVMPHF